MPPPTDSPVLLLGGSTGPLAIARELDARGLDVHLSLLSGRPELATRHAAAKHPYASHAEAPGRWSELLLGDSPKLDRAVVFPCDDHAVEFVAAHHSELTKRHQLDRIQPEHLSAFLDKARTAELLAGTGVRLPRTWSLDEASAEPDLFGSGETTILLKPVHSHRFQRAFGSGGKKLFVARNRAEFDLARGRLEAADVEAVASEFIAGPDSASVTYYTYRLAGGAPVFEFTKQVLRRYPRNEGPGSLHVALWDEEVGQASRELLDAVHFEGYANIEFKRDPRDGRPTLIEVNPRFTASQELLARAGIPAGWIVHQAVTGGEIPEVDGYVQGQRLWDPARDVRAFLQHRREEGLGAVEWIRSLRGPRVLPLFRWSDPAPTTRRLLQLGGRALSRS